MIDIFEYISNAKPFASIGWRIGAVRLPGLRSAGAKLIAIPTYGLTPLTPLSNPYGRYSHPYRGVQARRDRGGEARPFAQCGGGRRQGRSAAARLSGSDRAAACGRRLRPPPPDQKSAPVPRTDPGRLRPPPPGA